MNFNKNTFGNDTILQQLRYRSVRNLYAKNGMRWNGICEKILYRPGL